MLKAVSHTHHQITQTAVPEIDKIAENVIRKLAKKSETLAAQQDSLVRQFREYSVKFIYDHGFTAAVIERGGQQFIGMSKRNPNDTNNPLRGRCLSLSRAVRAAVRESLKKEHTAGGF